jgi:hypothetical protein
MKKNIALCLTIALLSSGASLHALTKAKKTTYAKFLLKAQNEVYVGNGFMSGITLRKMLTYVVLTGTEEDGKTVDKFGETPLIIACRGNNLPLATLILEGQNKAFSKGAKSAINFQIKKEVFSLHNNNRHNIGDYSALDLAIYFNNKPLIALLKKHRAELPYISK